MIEYYLTQNSNLDQFVTFYNKSEVIALLLHTWLFLDPVRLPQRDTLEVWFFFRT